MGNNCSEAINSFIDKYDLSEKTIIPFCTHDGYGSGASFTDIRSSSGANVLEGIAISSDEVLTSQQQVEQWIDSLNVDFGKSFQNINIQIGNIKLAGILNDSKEAEQFKAVLPQTISMSHYGNREYYGGIDEKITVIGKGQLNFENGDITFCPKNNTIAIFYNQSDQPNLTMEVYVIGKVTSDLAVFDELESSIDITFTLQ